MSSSPLESLLRSGRFAVTAELTPPVGADPREVVAAAEVLAPAVDAINVTDNAGASVHMSSLACCALLVREGYEPIFQLSCRDRNRLALQSDLLGAAALGVRNAFLVTGDDVAAGDHPQARGVFDVDSLQALRIARTLCDEGRLLSGRELSSAPRLFLGAASNPFAPPHEWRPHRLAKKAAAGARFIQTQYCFDVPRMARFMSAVRDLGLHERLFILVGVGPLRSRKAAELVRTRVPGVVIPDEILARLGGVPEARQRHEGLRICVEIIQQLLEIEGLSGIHLMAYRQEEWIPEILASAGLSRHAVVPAEG